MHFLTITIRELNENRTKPYSCLSFTDRNRSFKSGNFLISFLKKERVVEMIPPEYGRIAKVRQISVICALKYFFDTQNYSLYASRSKGPCFKVYFSYVILFLIILDDLSVEQKIDLL